MNRVCRLLSISLVASAACLVLANGAEAFNAKVQRACKGDYKRLCPQYKVGSPQLRACMEAKSSDISSNCITTLIEEGVVDRLRQARR